jgi:hypothetical protein
MIKDARYKLEKLLEEYRSSIPRKRIEDMLEDRITENDLLKLQEQVEQIATALAQLVESQNRVTRMLIKRVEDLENK